MRLATIGRVSHVPSSTFDLSLTDPAVRVQDDLFRHVNGRWLATEPIPDDKPVWGVFTQLRDRSEAAVREILDDLLVADRDSLDPERRKVAALYAGFMDEARVEELDAAPLADLLARVDAIGDVAALRRHLGWAVRHGIGSLLGTMVEADPGDPRRYVLFVAQDGLGLPDESYYREERHASVREAYVAHVARTLTLAGAADADAQAALVMELETAVAACHWDVVRTRDLREMYNLMTLGELADSAPGFGWAEVLAGAGIDDRVGEVVNAQPSFFTDVAALLTDDRLDAWRAWARWHTVSAMSPYLSQRFVDERFDFYGRTLQGTQQLRARWKRGVDLAEGVLGEAIGKEYVARHFPPAAKARIDELVASLIEAYRRSITDLDWMTSETKAEALGKLARFTPKIAYPAEWRDYSALEVADDDLVGNVLRAASFDLDHHLDKLTGEVNPHEWLMTPQTVNAYYHPLRNEIVFPAAILQPPFFDADADPAVNYGGIGAVIGHEIGHGFDDQGSTCDGEGRLRDWWTAADRTAFESRTKALVDQYAALAPAQTPDHFVNGELTIGENIGDLGGLGIAIKAWRLAGGDTDDARVGADGLTGIQRLFWSWATVWRTKMHDEAMRQRLATDPHSPAEFRCNQTVRNLDEFHAAFDVCEGDALWLAPEERVTIW